MSGPKPFSYASALTGKQPNPHPKPAASSPAQTNSARDTHPPQRPSRQTEPQNQPQTRPQPRTRNQTSSQPSAYTPNPSHIPRTTSPESRVYVLTLLTTPSLQNPLDTLRTQHFPRHLNRTPAHLTLFHALPHSRLPVILSSLQRLSTSTSPFAVSTGKPFRLRRGVAIAVGRGYNQIKRVHAGLRDEWAEFLSEQDAGGWRGHWTVMNKAEDEESVVKAWEEVVSTFGGAEGAAVGVTLWVYERGQWVWERDVKFEGVCGTG